MIRWLFLIFLSLAILHACKESNPVLRSALPATDTIPQKKALDTFSIPQGWQEILSSNKITIDIKYATTDNFVGEQLYDCGRCYLTKEAAIHFQNAVEELYTLGYGVVLYDCYRPRPVQQALWNKVPNPSYVTPPKKGSMHNRGLAIDIGLTAQDGNYLDMGTAYDYFGKEAHHDYYQHDKIILNRRVLLKNVMKKHDFIGIRTEWWHYAYSKKSMDLSDWEWACDE